jgi:hypothetical protein
MPKRHTKKRHSKPRMVALNLRDWQTLDRRTAQETVFGRKVYSDGDLGKVEREPVGLLIGR